MLSQTPAPVRVSIHDELVLVILSPESAVCAASEELVPGHEGETGDAVLRRGLPALHTALPAAALYTPDSNLTSHVIDIHLLASLSVRLTSLFTDTDIASWPGPAQASLLTLDFWG